MLPKSGFGTLLAPAWLFFPFGSGSAARRVGSSFQSCFCFHHWAVTYVHLPVGHKATRESIDSDAALL